MKNYFCDCVSRAHGKESRNMLVRKSSIVVYLYILSTIPPNALVQYGSIKLLFNIVQVVCFLYFGVAIMRRERLPILFYILILFDFLLIVSTVVGNHNFYTCFTEIFNNLALPLLIFSQLIDYERLINVLRNYFNIIFWINFVYLLFGVFVLGNAADDSLFIVDSNGITIYFIITFMLEIIYLESRCKLLASGKRVTMLGFAISAAEILVWSGTGMIAWFSFLGLFLLSQIGRKKNIPFFITNISVFVASFIVFNMGISTIFFSFIDFLGKEITLTGRIYIWQSAINKIKSTPMSLALGYGYAEPGLNNYVAHNEILELLTNGGVALLLCFFLIYVFMGIKYKSELNSSKSNISVIKAAIFAIGIDMITEIEPWSLVFLIFCLLYLCIIRETKKMEEI